jgi:uncharacterized membrane protein
MRGIWLIVLILSLYILIHPVFAINTTTSKVCIAGTQEVSGKCFETCNADEMGKTEICCENIVVYNDATQKYECGEGGIAKPWQPTNNLVFGFDSLGFFLFITVITIIVIIVLFLKKRGNK